MVRYVLDFLGDGFVIMGFAMGWMYLIFLIGLGWRRYQKFLLGEMIPLLMDAIVSLNLLMDEGHVPARVVIVPVLANVDCLLHADACLDRLEVMRCIAWANEGQCTW
jgi:hypothetical protein